MTIDEAIVHAREVASRKFDDRVHCIRCAEEHEQLAEWLEELKAYRAIGTLEECLRNKDFLDFLSDKMNQNDFEIYLRLYNALEEKGCEE